MADCSGDAERKARSHAEAPSDPRPETPAQTHVMTDEVDGRRLDVALAEVADISRARVQRWIHQGRVEIAGRPARASTKVTAGTIVRAFPPEAQPTEVLAEDLPLVVLHEDEDLLVVDKAAGMVVHPAPGHRSGTLVNALLHHFRSPRAARAPGHAHGAFGSAIGGVERPGIVHRLDRGTSGVMVVAKNDATHLALAAQFQDHSIERVYRAFVRVVPGRSEGRVDRAIGRHPRDRKKMSVRTRRGRSAVTNWKVEERFPASAMSLLSVRPETGRTHQIRVHLSASGMPIAGDPVYGKPAKRRSPAEGVPPLDRAALHASVLGFRHPGSGESLRFEADFPPDLSRLLAWLRACEPDFAR